MSTKIWMQVAGVLVGKQNMDENEEGFGGVADYTFVIAALRRDEPLADLTRSTIGVFFAD